ncbi:hypothetical protein BOSP111201_12555 [Bordetella sputigena]|uniref:hypothetical protein n=1 Tax=Bordetella sputigena TaxID=1416810 RepID=UPI0039EF050A
MSNISSYQPLAAPSIATQAGFAPGFFQRYVAEAGSADGRMADAAERGGIRYCEDVHGPHADFCLGADFPEYRRQVRANLDLLHDFCRRHAAAEAEAIAARFDLFYRRRFTASYFDKHEHLLDSRGKQALDNFCELIRDARIAPDKKLAAIRNLSEGVGVCAPGVVSNLILAEEELVMSSTGIRAALWKVKHDVARAVILREVHQAFHRNPGYVGYETHYVRTVWNHLADAIGLVPEEDPFTRRLALPFLQACLEKVRLAITPDTFARMLADQWRSMFGSGLAQRRMALSADCSASINEDLLDILAGIRRECQLTTESLRLHAFVRLDDDGARYCLRGDVTLIALDILRIMRAESLLEGEPIDLGQWTDGDGARHAMLAFGSLIWRADLAAAPSASDGGLHACADQLTIPDLLAWCAAYGVPGHMLPSAALTQALDGADRAAVDSIPASWLIDVGNLLAVLPRMTPQVARQRMDANLEHYGRHLSIQARSDLIDRAMGMNAAILVLAQAWYRNPWQLLGESLDAARGSRLQYWMATDNGSAIDALQQPLDGRVYLTTGTYASDVEIFQTLRGSESRPALNVAMEAGNIYALAAWRRLVKAPGVLDRIGNRLTELLLARASSLGLTALRKAMGAGRAAAVEAFFDLLADPAITPHIRNTLPELLLARTALKVPGLLFAMERGHTSAVQAYRAVLVHPAIYPHIKRDLPVLVGCRCAKGTATEGASALGQGMQFGRAAAIRAYHQMMVDPLILPHIGRILPRLMTDKRNGRPCLAAAMYFGYDGAIREFHAILADPLITPLIRRVLPRIVLARISAGEPRDVARASSSCGQPGLGVALAAGYVAPIKAFHELLADPAILPHVGRILPKVFVAINRERTPGLVLALRGNHAAAIDAYSDALADPAILPFLRHVLARLLEARDASGTPGILSIDQEANAAAVAAYRRMLDRPELAPYIKPAVLQRLRAMATVQALGEAASMAGRTTRGPMESAAAAAPLGAPLAGIVQRLVRRLTLRVPRAG